MSLIKVDVDLYSSGSASSQPGTKKNGYLSIKKRELCELTFAPNVIGESYQGHHLIVFEMTDDELKFCDLEDQTAPGFMWIGNSPGPIMDVERKDNGRLIHLRNHHAKTHPHPDHTCGHWYYQLSAKNVHGDVYSIPLTSSNGPGDANPSIKNR